MFRMNHVTVAGRLTRDPELKHSQGGTFIVNFSIAANEVYKKDGEKVENVHFIDCVAFGNTAEIIAKHFEKGKAILVDGSLAFSSWEDKNSGEKRSKLQVKVRTFEFEIGNAGNGSSPNNVTDDDDIAF